MTRPFCYMVFHAAEEAVSFFVESLIKPTQAMENLPWNYDMKVPMPWSCTIEPAKTDWTFSPPNNVYTTF